MAKVTGKFQITLPKVLVERSGIRVGDELTLRAIGQSILVDRPAARGDAQRRGDRLAQFDRATERQRTRQQRRRPVRARTRGWTREELYVRGRPR